MLWLILSRSKLLLNKKNQNPVEVMTFPAAAAAVLHCALYIPPNPVWRNLSCKNRAGERVPDAEARSSVDLSAGMRVPATRKWASSAHPRLCQRAERRRRGQPATGVL